MVVAYQMVINAAGPEGTVRVAIDFDTDPSGVRTDYFRNKVVQAYRVAFETDATPDVTSEIVNPNEEQR
jgi:hypothetical protein